MSTWAIVGIVAATFVFMEFVAWATHKTVMHGFLWSLHRDHHRKDHYGFLEYNDSFFPDLRHSLHGAVHRGQPEGASHPWLWIGLGILLYGIAYFIVHEVFIHQRIKWLRTSRNVYFLGRAPCAQGAPQTPWGRRMVNASACWWCPSSTSGSAGHAPADGRLIRAAFHGHRRVEFRTHVRMPSPMPRRMKSRPWLHHAGRPPGAGSAPAHRKRTPQPHGQQRRRPGGQAEDGHDGRSFQRSVRGQRTRHRQVPPGRREEVHQQTGDEQPTWRSAPKLPCHDPLKTHHQGGGTARKPAGVHQRRRDQARQDGTPSVMLTPVARPRAP